MAQKIHTAQEFIFSRAKATKPKGFQAEKTISVVNGQEAYSLPDRIFLSNIEMIEYSSSGNSTDYYPINYGVNKERSSSHTGHPSGYSVLGSQFLLHPPATGGSLRVTFAQELDRLSIRRGKISAHTKSATQVTALTLDSGESSFDLTELLKHNHLCVVNRQGEVVMRNLEYDSIDGAGIVTITGAAFTFASGETLENGHYVVAGQNATNKSALPSFAERFLIEYAAYLTQRGKHKKGAILTEKDAIGMADDILENFGMDGDDQNGIPITDTSYLEDF